MSTRPFREVHAEAAEGWSEDAKAVGDAYGRFLADQHPVLPAPGFDVESDDTSGMDAEGGLTNDQ